MAALECASTEDFPTPALARVGRYQLLRRLAVGGTAELFLARSIRGSQPAPLVVVKRLLPQLQTEVELVRMFILEARIAARLTHRNIARIYDIGATAHDFFFTMEYVNGRDLRCVQDRAARLGLWPPLGIVARIARDLCSALEHAHTATDAEGRPLGIVHRDVSPQNVMLSFRGEVKLVDFGIATATSTAAEADWCRLAGKYAYLSPEQCRGRQLDARSDIFSLGVLLHELVCQRRLFRRSTELATMRAILEDPIPPPSALVRGVPDDLERIITTALARSPEQRYPSARAMQIALEQCMLANGWDSAAEAGARYVRRLFADEDVSTPAPSLEPDAVTRCELPSGRRPFPLRPVTTLRVVPREDAGPEGAGAASPAQSAASEPPARQPLSSFPLAALPTVTEEPDEKTVTQRPCFDDIVEAPLPLPARTGA